MSKTKTNFIKISLFISFNLIFCFFGGKAALAKEIDSYSVLNLINISRQENNLLPLKQNDSLSQVAKEKAQDMVKNHYFSHTSPTGITPWYWFEKNNYTYRYAGENLAINYTDAQEEHIAWMNSPTHKKNILSKNFSEIGIATAQGIIDGKRSTITVTVFASPQIFSQMPQAEPSKQSYILGAQKSIPLEKKPLLINQKFLNLIQNQSHKLIWTIALIAILIVSRDIVLKTINSKSFHHKHSLVNLILFVVIYSIFF